MATKTWDGETDGNFGTAANWVGDVAPVDTNDIIINDTTRAIDQGLTTALDFASLIVGPDYGAELGTSTTNPLSFGCTGGVVINGGGPRHYIEANASGIEELRVISVGASGKEHVYLTGGTFNRVIVEKGTLHVEGATIGTLILKSSTGVEADAKVEINSGTVTALFAMTGQVTMPVGSTGTIATLYCMSAGVTIDDGTLTNVIQTGGTINWNVEGGTITLARIIGGLFNSNATPGIRTITTLEAYRNVQINVDNGFDNIVITNEKSYGAYILRGT